MKNFLFVYRADYAAMPQDLSPEQMQATTQRWMDWVGSIAAQGKLAGRGSSLMPSGKTLGGGNVVTDGPYAEIKESIMGYSMIKVDSYEEALEIAQGCPILPLGTVEIREIKGNVRQLVACGFRENLYVLCGLNINRKGH